MIVYLCTYCEFSKLVNILKNNNYFEWSEKMSYYKISIHFKKKFLVRHC